MRSSSSSPVRWPKDKMQCKNVGGIFLASFIFIFIIHQARFSVSSALGSSKSQLAAGLVEMKAHRLLMTKPKNATTLAIAQSEELSTICEAQITEAVATANNAARLQTDFLVRELGKECERRVEQAAEEELSGQGDGSANEEEQQKENARESLALSILEADILTLKATLAKYNASMAAEWAAALEAQPKRGILVIAGPQRYSMNAFVSLWAVRKHFKSKLPVIIM